MYSTVLIIGAGESGLCMAAQLKNRFKHTDFAVYERHSDVGGTWYANSYPGAELHDYFTKFTDSYNLRHHITFNTEAVSARYLSDRQLWSVRLRRRKIASWETKLSTDDARELQHDNDESCDTWTHECKLLFTAVGGLVEPADFEIPGREKFKGNIFHSAVWDHTVDIKGKNVVIIGNGCSAAQIVPAIIPEVKSLTQIIRSPHWILPRPQFPGFDPSSFEKYSPTLFRYIPGLQALSRALMFVSIEAGWLGFRNDALGEKIRIAQKNTSLEHIKKNAPEKYWDILIPTFPVGFKRRIFDDTYLPTLADPKMTLTKDEITYLSKNHVHTASGESYKAEVIILATGFKTNEWIAPFEIVGKDGISLRDHWEKMGGPGAYNSTAVNGFPNMFMIVGPNSITGHTSFILASENMCRYALNIAKPVITGDASEVEVKKEAEEQYSNWLREQMKGTVFDNKQYRSASIF
ncbi:hypothetical protein TWF696_002490 [Orbilia brochopaga]|uniref:Flavin-containing monooxygenase n=1 Tax=Orbilia brochopaga TaxID=3140254 RepID=A0AAV9U1F1_9PEZI